MVTWEQERERKIEFPPLANLSESPEYRRILAEEALRILTTEDAKWFYSEYSGDLSPEGYLIDKNGRETNFLPSQVVGPRWIEQIGKVAEARFAVEDPEEYMKFRAQETKKEAAG